MVGYNYKKLLKSALANMGLEVKRIEQNKSLPRYFDDPIEALLFCQGGKQAAFPCPLGQCTHYTGLGFRAKDWHPFVETLKEYRIDQSLVYEKSRLKKFYSNWQPTCAAEAIAGFTTYPKKFLTYPPHYMFLSPWSSLTPAEVDIDIRWWNQKDNTEHGRSDLRYPDHGWAFFGPTHPDKGDLEYKRLTNLYNSIREHGYDRSQGFVGVTLLKRGSECIFLVGGGGYHRAAVMRALNYKIVPAVFHRNSIVDIDDVANWPNVKNGMWTINQAKGYVNHLYDFDSHSWLKKASLA